MRPILRFVHANKVPMLKLCSWSSERSGWIWKAEMVEFAFHFILSPYIVSLIKVQEFCAQTKWIFKWLLKETRCSFDECTKFDTSIFKNLIDLLCDATKTPLIFHQWPQESEEEYIDCWWTNRCSQPKPFLYLFWRDLWFCRRLSVLSFWSFFQIYGLIRAPPMETNSKKWNSLWETPRKKNRRQK